MAVATSGEKQITIDGQKFRVRTEVVYQSGLGVPGTLSTTAPIRYVVQYKPEPFLTNQFINLGERDPTNKNNWIFTPAAGSGFQKALVENGPNSLTSSLDDATSNALSQSAGVTKQQATQILQVAPNVAPTAPAPVQPTPSAGQSTDDSDDSDDELPAPKPATNEEFQKLKIASGPAEGTVRGKLAAIEVRYPEDIDTNAQDVIMFRLKEITGRKFGTAEEKNPGQSQFSFGSKSFSETFGSVVLPIQPSITDSNGVEWGGADLDPLSAYAGKAALSIMTTDRDIGTATLAALKDAGGEFKKNFGSYSSFLNLYFAQQAVGATGLLSRATGAVLNPNLELLFSGPTLRTFSFTFKLSPRSSSEAKIVKDIIFFFKAGMAVRKANTGVFLKAPYVFSIQYMSGNQVHKSLNRIKECALLGCDVDYTPDGSYMTFNDTQKTLTSYQLTLRFSELDPLYNDNYVDPHPIGY